MSGKISLVADVLRILTVLYAALSVGVARAQIITPQRSYTVPELCVSHFLVASKTKTTALGIAAPEAERLVRRIISKLGSTNQPIVFPCDSISDAKAVVVEEAMEWPDEHIRIEPGEYIIYNPKWTRQVIGSDIVQATVLFGHEIGHLINRDYTGARKNMTIISRETEADFVAGCAAARSGLKFIEVSNLLARLREDDDSDYPSRLKSIESAAKGFNSCVITSSFDGANIGRPIAKGYVYYEELVGSPTSEGVFTPLLAANNPHYGELTVGTILKAVRTARFRTGPSSLARLASPEKVEAGECVKILNKPAHPVRVSKATSGGHLEVELLSTCQLSKDEDTRTSSVPSPPVLTYPYDNSLLETFPRVTTLRWRPSERATHYSVMLQYQLPTTGQWFDMPNYPISIEGEEYILTFVGAQPGRWRVEAVNDQGRSAPSNWWYFRFAK